MLLRAAPLLSVIFITACSSGLTKNSKISNSDTPLIKYSQGKSKIVPVNPVVSSNDACVDHFNFLRQAVDDKYQKYSRRYVDIGAGFTFLNTNKNIMNDDAKKVYTNTLEMKLMTLCSEVSYAGFLVIQKKIDALGVI